MRWRDFAPAAVFRSSGENRGLMLSVWWNVMLLVLSVAALPFDHRRIMGLNPWIKPIKFELSVILFLLTIAVLLSAVGRSGQWRRLRQTISWGIGLSMIVENSIIAMQSLRGVRSHMNYATLFDGVSFAVMGVAILISTVLVSILLGLYCIARTGLPPALTWGIRLGLLMLLAGSVEGSLMIAHGAHLVGAADGAPGLPFVNWSTQYGDLRVATLLRTARIADVHHRRVGPVQHALAKRLAARRSVPVCGSVLRWGMALVRAGDGGQTGGRVVASARALSPRRHVSMPAWNMPSCQRRRADPSAAADTTRRPIVENRSPVGSFVDLEERLVRRERIRRERIQLGRGHPPEETSRGSLR